MRRDSRVGHPGALWTLLSNMRIEEPGAARTFEQALAEAQAWPEEYARAVAGEYRRFLYLAASFDEPVTPSIAVDAAWHLHLTYSRHYWETLCGEILGRPLHHEPSAGGPAEEARHRAQYEATLRRYEAIFLDPPPASIWPRLDPEPVPEEAERGRPAIVTTGLVAGAIAAVLAAAGAGPVVGMALVCIAVGLGLAALFPSIPQARANGSGGCGGGGGGDGCAGCGGGCGGGCG